MTLAKPSTTMRNTKGVRGSLCLSPLVGWNCSVKLPLTRMEIDEDSR